MLLETVPFSQHLSSGEEEEEEEAPQKKQQITMDDSEKIAIAIEKLPMDDSEKIAIAIEKLPEEYQPVLTTEMRKEGSMLTTQHIENATFQQWWSVHGVLSTQHSD